MEIGLTYRCQLNCVHCGVYGQRDDSRSELSREEVFDLIDQSYSLGIYFIIFSGGEPLMRDEISDYVKHSVNRGIMAAVSTNGLLLSKGVILELKKSGISFINLSIDSADPAMHDKLRGLNGCFLKASQAITDCVKVGIPVLVSTYATKENIASRELEKIISFSRCIGASGVRVLLAARAGKWSNCLDLSLSEAEKEYLGSLLDPCYVYFEGVCNKFTECNAALKKLLYVSAYGDVQPCSFVPINFGNIRNDTLAGIWLRMSKNDFYSSLNACECITRSKVFYDKLIV